MLRGRDLYPKNKIKIKMNIHEGDEDETRSD
jgi:hypothetical protein